MIIKASQRGSAKQLAAHLLNKQDNEHVTVHEVRGFVSDDIEGAFNEAHAISKGTKCEQFLFSASFNPPQDVDVSTKAFERAIDKAEERLNLTGQPRAIVFHEKNARRHAHVVWSRIDGQKMKAINMNHYKNKLNILAKELYLEHGWTLPKGFRDKHLTNPLNFTREQWEQAKRTDRDPREIKQLLRESLAPSSNKKTIEKTLHEHGFKLARGDRRGFVVMDYQGEVYSLSRWSGVRVKDLKTQIGDPQDLKNLDEVKSEIQRELKPKYREYIKDIRTIHRKAKKPLIEEKQNLVETHKAARQEMGRQQKMRWKEESAERQALYRTGLKGLFDKVTGREKKLKLQNQQDIWQKHQRDQLERDNLIFKQLEERKALQEKFQKLHKKQSRERKSLAREISRSLGNQFQQNKNPERERSMFKQKRKETHKHFIFR